MKRRILALVAVSTTLGCVANEKQGASLTYDLGSGSHTLHTYPLEPSARVPPPVKLANGKYVVPEARSPKLAYYCTWRDISPLAISSREKPKGAPSQIFLVCIFGSSPWSPPERLIDVANERFKREEAVVRATWERRGERYVATRFEVEIKHPPELNFRSANFGAEELAAARLKESAMGIPRSPEEPFSFDLSVSAPYRHNSGQQAGTPIASLRIKGVAAPSPRWLVY